MSADQITVENLSVDLMKSIFDDAYLKTTVEGDDDDDKLLYVEDGKFGCYVVPSENLKEVRFVMYARVREDVSRLARLEAANKANLDWKAVRMLIHDNGRCAFEFYLFIHEGISRKSLVLTYKKFMMFTTDVFNDLDII